MVSISKSFSMLLILILAASSLIMAKQAFAQSTEPSPPNFTIQIPNSSTIQLVIENQAFINTSSVNSIVYYYRVKPDNSDVWNIDGDYTLQSNSDTTIISIPPLPGVPGTILSTPQFDNVTLIDFQVQAVTGFYNVTWVAGYMPGMPTQVQSGNGYSDITFNPAESSDWSPTQTVTIPASFTSTSTSPTPTPTSTVSPTASPSPSPTIPEFPTWIILPFFAIIVLLSNVFAGKRNSVRNVSG